MNPSSFAAKRKYVRKVVEPGVVEPGDAEPLTKPKRKYTRKKKDESYVDAPVEVPFPPEVDVPLAKPKRKYTRKKKVTFHNNIEDDVEPRGDDVPIVKEKRKYTRKKNPPVVAPPSSVSFTGYKTRSKTDSAASAASNESAASSSSKKKKKKNLTGRKHTVLQDELNIKGSGIYCLMPYEQLDKQKKAVFKVGMAVDSFRKRMEQFHTYFPLGVYYVAFLQNSPVRSMALRGKPGQTKKMKYLEIEDFIMNTIREKGGRVVRSTTRVKDANVEEGGVTEWVYSDEIVIHESFKEAEKKYGGKLHLFYLEGLNPDTMKLESINDIAKENKKKNLYTGQIIYKR